jgi:hypothetical protein
MPISLLSDETEILKKVLLHLTNLYYAEMTRDAVPASVQNMMTRISAELASRVALKPEPPKIDSVAIGRAYRQRFYKKRT